MQYQVSIPTLMDFFCQGEHQGFSEADIQTAEKTIGVALPTIYRDFLKTYGLDPINNRHNHINCPPKGIVTSYSYIQDTLEDWAEEFQEAKEQGQENRYKDNGYFALWQLPQEKWSAITDNYVLLRFETWVNNAGLGNYDSVAQQDLEKINTMLRLNVEALTILSSLFVRDYKDALGTQLINLSSCGGYTIVPTAVTYCATKFYVSTFTEGLAWELIETGAKMRAKVLAPAATQTEFGKKANNVDALLGEQRVFPAWAHEPILSPQPEAQAIPVADLPPHVFHEHKEVAQVVGVLNGRPQVRLQHGAEGGLAPGLAEPFDVADRFARAALHDDGQPMLPAQPARGGPNLLVVALGIAVVLLSGVGVHGVKNQMGVDMLLVHMDTDHGFIAHQMLLRELLGDLQGLLRGDLPRLEGLDDVVILHTIFLAIGPLGIQHLAALPAWVAVEVGGEDALLGLVPVEDVVDAHVQAALPGQDLRDSHRSPRK